MARYRIIARPDPNRDQAYKGYLIRKMLTGGFVIVKDQTTIGYADTMDQAKSTVDILT